MGGSDRQGKKLNQVLHKVNNYTGCCNDWTKKKDAVDVQNQ